MDEKTNENSQTQNFKHSSSLGALPGLNSASCPCAQTFAWEHGDKAKAKRFLIITNSQ